VGSWPEHTKSPTVIQTMPLWPTVWADAGAKLSMVNCYWRTLASAVCTPEMVQVQAAAFEHVAASSGHEAALSVNGTFVDVQHWAGQIPVLSTETKLAGELEGRGDKGWAPGRQGAFGKGWRHGAAHPMRCCEHAAHVLSHL
jgi:hypothetical protein